MTKCCNNFILNGRKRRGVLNTQPSTVKENIIVSDNTSTEDLLKQPIEINEEQKELLSDNNNSSKILEKIIFVFAGLTLISTLSSMSLAFLQLNGGQDITGLAIIIFTYSLIFIGIVVSWKIIFPNLFKNRESKPSTKLFIHNVLLVVAVGLGIGLPIIFAILYQFNPIILIIIITIVYLIILFYGFII